MYIYIELGNKIIESNKSMNFSLSEKERKKKNIS